MRNSTNTITLSSECMIEEENLSSSPIERVLGKSAKTPHSELPANESKGKTKLEESLTKLVRLIANITESYSSAIFVSDTKNQVLHSLAHHSLSRDYIEGVSIPYGRGLVGWTAENKVRITVCPFEHDASTLLYYPSDQALKSFIAVPILSIENEVLGVIACDSKKSYAFAKITEKILTECAAQAELLINLHQTNERLSHRAPLPNSKDELESAMEKLRASDSEVSLLESVCKLPQSLLTRDAFIALVTSNEGYGEATFYSHTPDTRVEHHLMDLVCKNKKILSSERSVHVLPSDDIRARSFLSVPFHAFGREAGALNILSGAFKPFSTSDIQTLEKLAHVIGRELERHRSKAIAKSRQVGPSLLPWKHFVEKGDQLISSNATTYALLRIQLENLSYIESELGVETCSEIHEQLLRFVQQLAPSPLLASAPYGTSIFIFGDKEALGNLEKRLKNLIARIHTVSGLTISGKLEASASTLLSESFHSVVLVCSRKIKSINELLKTGGHITDAPIKLIPAYERPSIEEISLDLVSAPDTAHDQERHETENNLPPANSQSTQTRPHEDIHHEPIQLTEDLVELKTSEIPSFRSEPTQMGTLNKREFKSIEEFILGDSAASLKGKKNARFW
jgi:putative methionine-R-sulfoxide reductase with GAF domain